MTEILFIVEEENGQYRARAAEPGIVATATSHQQLIENVRKSVRHHFDKAKDSPKVAHLHYVRDETISLEPTETAKTDRAGVEAEIRNKLQGSVLQDDDPYGPAVPPEDWEAVR